MRHRENRTTVSTLKKIVAGDSRAPRNGFGSGELVAPRHVAVLGDAPSLSPLRFALSRAPVILIQQSRVNGFFTKGAAWICSDGEMDPNESEIIPL